MSLPNPLQPLAFPLHGSRLIEASAGTGKTYTIAALYVRLILGQAQQKPALLPPEILVVTFTEAATKELRERIRQRLTEAAQCFRGLTQPQPDDEFMQMLLASYAQAHHAGCARLLEVAAQWMDEAAIYTIHSWCKRMLRQHAFASGSLFELELDAQDSKLLTDVIRDYWRKFYYPLPASLSSVISQLLVDPDVLAGRLKPLLAVQVSDNSKRVYDYNEAPSCFEQWQQWADQQQNLEYAARQCWQHNQAALEKLLSSASENGWFDGRVYNKAKFAERLAACAAWAAGEIPGDEKTLTNFAQHRFKMSKAHADKTPVHEAFRHLQTLLEHSDQQPDLKQQALLHAAQWVKYRYQQQKYRRARLDFDDLLNNLHRALQSSTGAELAQLLRSQFPIAMIDEFQDTDPIQYHIFNLIYQVNDNSEHTGLFLIGDPKQAIYSFRGADIFTYLQARLATQQRHYTLTTNFRATQPLVDAVNRVFSYADQHPHGAFHLKPESGDNPVPFIPVQASGRSEQFVLQHQPQPALLLWQQSGAETLSKADYLQRMAEHSANEIAMLLNSAKQQLAGFRTDSEFKALKPADIAVLVRDWSEAKAMKSALSARHINSVYLSDRDSVFHSPEAVDVLIWLKACAEPNQDRLVRAALATATLRQSYQDLDLLNQDELAWEAVMNQFQQYRRVWRRQGILAMLRQLLHDYELPKK
ncbi:MAG: UvrD-helicase domain-containing protein, partial [Methylococcales bacterium]